MSKKGSNPGPTFKRPLPPPPPPRKVGCLGRVTEVFKSIERALNVPGRFEVMPDNMTLQCIKEPRKIIRELLDAINDIPFTDEELIKAITRAENYLKEIIREKAND